MEKLRKVLIPRVFIISLTLMLQLIVLIAVILRFNEYFAFFYGASIFLSIIALLWIINDKSNPAYKIGWIIPILLFPIFGGLFYIFFGRNKLNKRQRKKMKYIADKTQRTLLPNENILEEIKALSEDAAIQSRYIQDYANFPPYNNTSSEYLPIGEIKFEKLKEELKKAKKFIFLEYFIIEEGVMWNSILEILVEKAQSGVDVRLIYDDFGCLVTLPYKYYRKLEQLGIKTCVFNPLIPLLSLRLNNRDHRKIVIIDGHTGITGGINLADEYINEIVKYGHWKDSAIMIKGEAVWNMTVMFLTMWDYLRGIDEDFNLFKPELPLVEKNIKDGFVQPFADNPLDDEPVGEIIYMNLINKAKRYVYITTPYLIIDNEMIVALTTAAKGGVDIRIITPYVADKNFVHLVTRSFYKILIDSGVKIYEYAPGFIHSKTFVTDDEYAVVGTINMDYRSLYLHFECGVWLYNSNSVLDVKEDFLETLEFCRQITAKDYQNVHWYHNLAAAILRVFAPLM